MRKNILPDIALGAGVVGLIGAMSIAIELISMVKELGELGSSLNSGGEDSEIPMQSAVALGQRITATVGRLVVAHIVCGLAVGTGVISLALDMGRLRRELDC